MKNEKRLKELKELFNKSLPLVLISILAIVPSIVSLYFIDNNQPYFCTKLEGLYLKVGHGTIEECSEEGYTPTIYILYLFSIICFLFLIIGGIYLSIEFIEARWFG